MNALREAEAQTQHKLPEEPSVPPRARRRFRVVTVTSNKGGVGKTTLAGNLAIYARALRERLPVLMLGFDDQTTLDHMFALGATPPRRDTAAAFSEGSFAGVAQLGQYGVHYVPSTREIPELKRRLRTPQQLQQMLLRTDWPGLVVIDTKSDFESLTQAAIAASDLVIVVVKDQASLVEARRVFELLEQQGRPPQTARILLSLVDLRVKFQDGEDMDVLAHLLSEIRREGWPLLETFISRSPRIEALYTNPQGQALSVLHAAPQSLVHRQLRQLTETVLGAVRLPAVAHAGSPKRHP